MKRKTFLKTLLGVATMATLPLASVATAQDAIVVGEINHYKRLAAFTGPYKQGIELALEESTPPVACWAAPWNSFSATIRANRVRLSRSPKN